MAVEAGLLVRDPEGWQRAYHRALGNRKTSMPMHGSRKELGPGLVAKIKKDPGLD